ncbi:IS1 family transposase [uncultured Polaribacter sp.]|uniref:IS1 family transposase n=1 Tax=uncultured Polaribacter sp. TaxID=174711 RepID=UPI0026038490|nr:IS1 family transposase [uncultured Polaribacter sp.]
MEKKICPKCNERNTVKNDFQKNLQRYQCKICNKNFQIEYSYKAYKKNTDKMVITLLKEGCGIRSISRILQISKNTVLSRMLKISFRIKPHIFSNFKCKFEVDEIWTFIGNKNKMTWVTYVIERKTKCVINFFVSNKSKKNIKPLMDKFLALQPVRIYTDLLNIYPPLIPKEIHRVFNYCTNIIERKNLTLRTHNKRLSRGTICYSRKQEYLEDNLKIYFWGYIRIKSKKSL